MRIFILVVLSLFLFSCSSVRLDPSTASVEAGDATLAVSCGAMPSLGADICRHKELSLIEGVWHLVLPAKGRVVGGEISVSYKDTLKSYMVSPDQTLLSIPLKEIVGSDVWSKEKHGFTTAMLRAKIVYKAEVGDEIVQLRGFAFFIVTSAEYEPLPINSPYVLFLSTCQIGYSSAGRGAISCHTQ